MIKDFEMDTTNRGLVTEKDGMVRVLNPGGIVSLSPSDAVMFAAWILVMAGASREQIEDALSAVEST